MMMTDLTLLLPSEILAQIFSHVNQVDCFECMIVCRRWYELILQHAKDIWKELEISETSWPRFNNTMLACLGTHVEKVSIFGYETSYEILQRLKDQECNIQYLEIQGPYRVHDFGLDRSTIFSGVQVFGRTLKELYIKGPSIYHCPLSLLLDLLPALTHLTFKLEGDPDAEYPRDVIYMNEVMIQTHHPNKNYYNLVFLCLDSEILCHCQVLELVKCCPRLTYLMGSFNVVYEYGSIDVLPVADILKQCPSIRYINWGEEPLPSKMEKKWLTLSRRAERKDNDKGNNNNYGEREASHLRQVGFCSTEPLDHVSTLKASFQNPSMLEHLHLSGITHSDLCYVWNTFTQQNGNLLSQPPQLKTLELVDFCVIFPPGNDLFFEGLFEYFQHVEQLKLHLVVGSNVSFEEERDNMLNLVQVIAHQLHKLRHLDIGFAYRANQETTMTRGGNLFTTLCDWDQKLEILHLTNAFISNEMLLDLCHHPNLHTLNLSGGHLHKHLTEDGLLLFARKLREQEQSGCGRIQSIMLSCGYCDDVTDEVLEGLAGVQSLKKLRIEYNKTITDAGINKFASILSSSNNNHNKVELYDCNNVSLGNPHVVFVTSPF